MNMTTLKLQHMGNKATSTSSEAQSLPVQCKAETNTALIHNKQNHWQNPFFVNHLSFCQKHHLNLMLTSLSSLLVLLCSQCSGMGLFQAKKHIGTTIAMTKAPAPTVVRTQHPQWKKTKTTLTTTLR